MQSYLVFFLVLSSPFMLSDCSCWGVEVAKLGMLEREEHGDQHVV